MFVYIMNELNALLRDTLALLMDPRFMQIAAHALMQAILSLFLFGLIIRLVALI